MTSVSHWTETWWVLLFVFVSCGDAVPDTFTVSGPDGPLSVWMGSSVFLPCSVSPAFTDSLELRWHRPEKYKTPVLLYEKQQIQEQSTDPQYRGRVSLTGELEKGNVSLKLENVTLADSGEYVCFVAGKKGYEQARVYLIVKAMGTHPVLSITDGGSGHMHVSCVSDGWFPKPTLTWRQQGDTEISQNFDTTVDAQGHVSVTSQLLLSPSMSKWLSCSVGLSEEERRESRILPYISDIDTVNELQKQLQTKDQSVWIVLFIVVFILLLFALAGLVFLYMKVLELKKKLKETDDGVEVPLQPNKDLKLDPPDDTKQHPAGKEGILSFSLSPKTSAVPMEIRWFKGKDCMYLYKNGQGKGQGSYNDRASLCKEDLENGSISLRLKNIQNEDVGNYVCQVIISKYLENALRINYSSYTKGCVIYPTECNIDEASRREMEASAKSLGSTCEAANTGEECPLVPEDRSV
ncbi:hypothetical protein ACEWY4_007183 [Coilia grayii]|uniref:Ig-like domain-containing protein n=1 Tax=Coilia grayii TaxID=363190 RepID=A0ABD1KFJ4_9TELE